MWKIKGELERSEGEGRGASSSYLLSFLSNIETRVCRKSWEKRVRVRAEEGGCESGVRVGIETVVLFLN